MSPVFVPLVVPLKKIEIKKYSAIKLWKIFINSISSRRLTSQVLFGFSLRDYFGYQMTYGSGLRLYTFPYWANYIGWTLAVVPLFAIPLFAIINLVRYSKKGVSATHFIIV